MASEHEVCIIVVDIEGWADEHTTH